MNRLEFLFSMAGAVSRRKQRKGYFKAHFDDPIGSICDYSQSYVTHITHGKANQARINIEARCIWKDLQDGSVKDYFKFASCKSENTYAETDLFMEPNYDFSGVYNEEKFAIFRSGQFHTNDIYAERGESRARFESIRVQLLEEKKFIKLNRNNEIVNATLDGKRLVGRSTYRRSETEEITLEYPIKTINVNDTKWIYQVDTGPIAVPHPKKKDQSLLNALELAFIAYNKLNSAYFVFNSPTPIEDLRGVMNNHYSEILEIQPVVNEIFALE